MDTILSSKQTKWNPISVDFNLKYIEKELKSWKNTKYMLGACSKGFGVDCVRFCCSIVDYLYGYIRCGYRYLPQDTCFHNKKEAIIAMKHLLNLYNPIHRIGFIDLEPMDLLVSGPIGGGPGHLVIVGPQKNTTWHVTNNGPTMTGMSPQQGYTFFRAYRLGDRHKWLK